MIMNNNFNEWGANEDNSESQRIKIHWREIVFSNAKHELVVPRKVQCE